MLFRETTLLLQIQRIINSRRTWQLPDLRQEKQVAGLYKLQDLRQVMHQSFIPKGEYEKHKFDETRKSEFSSRPDGRTSHLFDWDARAHQRTRRNRLMFDSKKFRKYYNDS